ncbi:MAG TPA: GAF domain-containing protein, partial [Actinomycetota bacterium]|nr:GAF domain-containing protein [Actinomycetota bacterium]
MSTVLDPKRSPSGQENLAAKLDFSKRLQAVTNRIHAAANIEEIMLEVSQDLCNLLDADRLTIYITSEDRQTIVSKVKTGLASFKDLKLPINDQSIAGYVAVHRHPVNLKDVYDDHELRGYKPPIHFLKEVDKRTGYRTRQMLVAPIVDSGANELLGVIQLINTKSGGPFPQFAEEGVAGVAETLAIALRQQHKAQQLFRGKFDHLVVVAAISPDELELATRSARRKNLDVEDVLIDEFQVKVDVVGNALAEFFGVPYQPYKADTVKPMDLLRNLNRGYLEENLWLPVEDSKD